MEQLLSSLYLFGTFSLADTFGEEWMETVDFQTLLNAGSRSENAPVAVSLPAVKKEEPEPRQEGMKQAAFELLKALLTGQQPTKTELSVDFLQPVESVETHAVISPVAEVPNIDFPGCDSINFLGDVENNPVIHSFEDLIQPEIPLNNGDVVEIQPSKINKEPFSISKDYTAIVQDSFIDTEREIPGSPFSSNDADSILSSSSTSPSENSTIDISYLDDTVDTSCYSEHSQSGTAKSIQVSSEDFTKLKSKSKRAKVKSTPYDSDQDNVKDKRLRKKMQNKNAATRYREKKRQEKETLQEQEVRLSDKNKELREKVESLQREIQYMKELMNEINKAKRSNI